MTTTPATTAGQKPIVTDTTQNAALPSTSAVAVQWAWRTTVARTRAMPSTMMPPALAVSTPSRIADSAGTSWSMPFWTPMPIRRPQATPLTTSAGRGIATTREKVSAPTTDARITAGMKYHSEIATGSRPSSTSRTMPPPRPTSTPAKRVP